jgi:hypothetical protein
VSGLRGGNPWIKAQLSSQRASDDVVILGRSVPVNRSLCHSAQKLTAAYHDRTGLALAGLGQALMSNAILMS